MEHFLPPLSYSYDALEPFIDRKTMEIHYTKHHQAYVDNLNNIVKAHPQIQDRVLSDLLIHLQSLPTSAQMGIRNHGGGHYNHSLFWKILKKNDGHGPRSLVKEAMEKTFETFDQCKERFNGVAKTLFGSGWAWLCLSASGELKIIATANQDCPLSLGYYPLLGLDVWEHAYYLQYQNRRVDYIAAWWQIVNWDQVEENYENWSK